MSNDCPILLAEDDPNDVFFFKRAVREAEVQSQLFVVGDGQEAIDYLSGNHQFSDRTQYPLPCLILLDLKMPRKNGMEVLRWLRTEASVPIIPVIIFSSSGQPEDIERAYRLGANAFVVKPPSLAKRAELVHFIKGFWLHYNQPPLFGEGSLESSGYQQMAS